MPLAQASGASPQGGSVLGAVLAGGQSRRFGSDKAMALWEGRALIDHAIDSLRRHTASVVICGRPAAGMPWLADRPRPDMGPLGGLNAALHHAWREGHAGVLTLGCDMPLLPDEIAHELIGAAAAIVQGQHLIGYWPSALCHALDDHLEGEDHSIRGWIARTRPKVVVAAGPTLPNVNMPSDLEILRRRAP